MFLTAADITSRACKSLPPYWVAAIKLVCHTGMDRRYLGYKDVLLSAPSLESVFRLSMPERQVS